MTAAWLARVPIRMHTFTGLVFPTQQGLMKKILITTDKIVCKMATHIYPEGQGVKNDLLNYSITSKPLKVLANGNINGIDTNHFTATHFNDFDKQTLTKKWNIYPDDFIFVFVGRLVGDKGINELIQAFTEIYTHNKTAKLLLVGPYEHELDPLEQSTLDAIYENTNIITVGFQDDIRPFLAISDVFVFPSYREGFPNVVMQAGAMGLPSIVTDINGSNEIIQHNHNGSIIPPKDTTALTHAMQQLIDNPTLRQSLAQNARPSITSRYEQQVVWDALLAEYQMLIDN
jgi:glycosyltransferase involved in cell wall biosynthesis